MDPHQRLFLTTVYEAIEDAGYGGKKIIGSRTGVYAGMSDIGDYSYIEMIAKSDPGQILQALSGNTKALLPGRVSYTFDLHGPSLLIDTACSSSLVALVTACKALKERECDMAIVGSVKIYLLPLKARQMIGIESSDGRTRTFDNESSGAGVGEGSIAVILKPFREALIDRDHIYAVIKGSALNQDGRSIGITAPNALAQADVIDRAWKDAQIEPKTINYIEVHGTGTKLGDPIEIDGLTRAFRKYTDMKGFCAIGAVKTNIGHSYDSSGLSSLIKVVFSLKNKIIAPNINFNIPNQKIDLINSPVYINDKLKKWEQIESARRCGVSSFGFSGTNSHVVLEETPVSENSSSLKNSKEIFTLSAMSQEAINDFLKRYIVFFEAEKEVNIHDFCYTVNTGRGHYDYRIAFLIESQNELATIISKLVGANPNNYHELTNINIYFGIHKELSGNKISKDNNTITYTQKQKLGETAETKLKEFLEGDRTNFNLLNDICELYIMGGDINWEDFYMGEKRNRIRLPIYPLKKERCWINIPQKRKISDGKVDGIIPTVNLNEKACDEMSDIGQTQSENIVLLGRDDGKYSETERKIARIWNEVLGVTNVNIYDDFFNLGGDSITGTKIANLVDLNINKNINVSIIMENPNINDLAQYLDRLLSQ